MKDEKQEMIIIMVNIKKKSVNKEKPKHVDFHKYILGNICTFQP